MEAKEQRRQMSPEEEGEEEEGENEASLSLPCGRQKRQTPHRIYSDMSPHRILPLSFRAS